MPPNWSNFELIGPFAEAQKKIDNFTANIYFTQMFNDTLKKENELRRLYDEASRLRDYQGMKYYREEIARCEQAYKVAASLLDVTDDINA